MTSEAGQSLEELIERMDQTTLEVRRLVLFVLVAIKEDVWPDAEFRAEPVSETDAQARELFYRMSRRIPQADRLRCWAEVDEVFPTGHSVT